MRKTLFITSILIVFMNVCLSGEDTWELQCGEDAKCEAYCRTEETEFSVSILGDIIGKEGARLVF